jgi:hypothetical protein
MKMKRNQLSGLYGITYRKQKYTASMPWPDGTTVIRHFTDAEDATEWWDRTVIRVGLNLPLNNPTITQRRAWDKLHNPKPKKLKKATVKEKTT